MSTATVPLATADSETAAIGPINGFVPRQVYPLEIPIFGKIHPNYRLVKPVLLTIERDEDGLYIVSDDVFYMHGAGAKATDAVKDYLQVLAEYYELLAKDTDEPSMALFEYVQTYLSRS